MRRSDRIQARLGVLLRPGRLDISVERVGCDVEEGGTGIYNACCVGKNGGSTVGDRLVDAPVVRGGGGTGERAAMGFMSAEREREEVWTGWNYNVRVGDRTGVLARVCSTECELTVHLALSRRRFERYSNNLRRNGTLSLIQHQRPATQKRMRI